MENNGDMREHNPFIEQVRAERKEAQRYKKSKLARNRASLITICFILFVTFITLSITIQQDPFLILGILSGIVAGITAVLDKEDAEPHEGIWMPQSFQLPTQEDYDNYYRYMDAISEVYHKGKKKN